MTTPAHRVLALWRYLSPVPGGKLLFSWLFSRAVPYSGTIHPRIRALEPGYARVEFDDRYRVRNHLDSVHAIALANVGELVSGLALTATMPPNARGIPVRITADYLKKARGPLVAESRVTLPALTGDVEHDVTADVRNQAGDVVARITARWRLSIAAPA